MRIIAAIIGMAFLALLAFLLHKRQVEKLDAAYDHFLNMKRAETGTKSEYDLAVSRYAQHLHQNKLNGPSVTPLLENRYLKENMNLAHAE